MGRQRRTHCESCGVQLTVDNCHRRSGALNRDSFRSKCNECRAADARDRNLDQEQANRIFVTRQVCDICSQPERMRRGGRVRLLTKDHDHRTGEWRGLLCSRCNQAIGLFNDHVGLLEAAIDYLKNPPALVLINDTDPLDRIEQPRR